jgi:hypothetical protein
VAISYLVQLSITLFFWLLPRTFSTLLWILRFEELFAKTVRRKFPTNRESRYFPDSRQTKAVPRNQLAILQSALVEFQEAQIFFVIATQVAIVAVLKLGLGTFESYSVLESEANKTFLLLIDATGINTIAFVLLQPQSEGVLSWYILALSSVGSVIALLSCYCSFTGSFALKVRPIPDAESLNLCGYKSPPISTCQSFSGPFDYQRYYSYFFLTAHQTGDIGPILPIIPWDPFILALWMIMIVMLLLRKTKPLVHALIPEKIRSSR